MAAAFSIEQRLPVGSFAFTCATASNAAEAATAGAELPAVDLYSLGISCTKLAATASKSPEDGDRRQAGCLMTLILTVIIALLKQAASAAEAATPAGSSSSSSSETLLSVLLCARTLQLLGQGFVTAGSADVAGQDGVQTTKGVQSADGQCIAQHQGLTYSWTKAAAACNGHLEVVVKLLPAVRLPGAAGSEQACVKARKQLQQQAKMLLGLLDAADLGCEAPFYLGTAPSMAAEQLPHSVTASALQFGQQLVQFSNALCAQLPLPVCCNNPCCVELRGASEQQLVAGKGKLCSRCRWVAARTC
jgi:hypothetical protein